MYKAIYYEIIRVKRLIDLKKQNFMKETFSIKEALQTGWQTFKEKYWFLMGVTLIIMLVPFLTSTVAEQFQGALSAGISLVDFALQTFIGMGLTFIILAVYSKKDVGFKDWLTPAPLFLKYLAVSILSIIATIGGFILFILPGFILMAGLMFATYLVVDKQLGPVDAIKKSWSISKGYKLKLIGFILVILLINLLGIIALLVGLLVTIPVTLLATVHVYRILLKRSEAQGNLANE